ncbi:MAG: single-stranded-DNA-specific exonuclease RecJ [Spirochaetes bacterium]|nr:single-stranded-DNA-specific exonuclease RecJ [Spirochaetota bacterium]
MKSNWIINVPQKEQAEPLSAKYDIPPTISEILLSRGFQDDSELLSFLVPEIYRMKSPFEIKDLKEAVLCLRDVISQKGKIAVFSDSDLDGLTSLSLIRNFLEKSGISYVADYPKNGESYGLTTAIVDYFHSKDAAVLLTLDCGIRDFKEIEYAGSLGMHVIVCDHHEPDVMLPDCICVDPKRPDCGFEFKDLAGVGVAYKLVHGLLFSYLPVFNRNVFLIHESSGNYHVLKTSNGVTLSYSEWATGELENLNYTDDDFIIVLNTDAVSLPEKISESINFRTVDSFIFNPETEKLLKKLTLEFRKFSYSELQYMEYISNLITFSFSEKIYNFMTEISPFAAIGTIADVVPLKGENRVIINTGLCRLKSSEIPSVAKIRDLCYRNFTSKNIAWTIGPLLNAPGRFGRTELTADFFSGTSSDISRIYDQIKSFNDKRKSMVDEIISLIFNDMSGYDQGDYLIIYNLSIHEGICGIIAGKLCDKFNKPAFVLSISRDGIIKGSARSPQNINLLEYAVKFSHIFDRFGGHNQAFGFSIKENNVKEFINLLKQHVTGINNEEAGYHVDAVIEIGNLNAELLKGVEKLEPFGNANPELIFCSEFVEFDSFQYFGKNNEHLKLIINNIEFLLWSMAPEAESFLQNKFHIIYTVSRTYFKSIRELRCEIVDFCPAV